MIRLICTLVAVLMPLKAMAIEIQEVTSPGGITAWLVEEDSIPFTALDIRFSGGANEEPLNQRGVTYLMMGLLEEGSADLDSQGFAEAAETLAARMSFDANNDSVSVGISFLTENRDASIALLRDALTDPTFDQAAVERVRDQVLAGLAAAARDPQEIASKTFAGLSFPGHPYGMPLEGTPETVSALTIADLGPLLDTLLGGLPATGNEPAPMVKTMLDGGVTVMDFPSPQSVVLFGQDGIAFEDPDYFAAFVLNHILGGSGFASRLMTEVREKRGLTYGIGTYLAPRDLTNQILGQFSSSNDKAAEAIEIVRTVWKEVSEGGVTQEQLDAAKTYLTGAYPLRFDGNSRIASILVGMQATGLPIDYIIDRNDKIDAVTLEDVRRVAARILKPEALHFVVVGQPEGLTTGSF